MVGVGGLDDMDFDALEAMQAMLERRKGGETGMKAVQMLQETMSRTAMQEGRWSKDLLISALSRSDTPLGLTLLDGRNQELRQQRGSSSAGERSRRLLPRIRGRYKGDTPDAERGYSRLQHCRTNRWWRNSVNTVLHAGGTKSRIFGMSRRKNRRDVSETYLADSSKTRSLNIRCAGSMPELTASIESANGNGTLGDPLRGSHGIAVPENLANPLAFEAYSGGPRERRLSGPQLISLNGLLFLEKD